MTNLLPINKKKAIAKMYRLRVISSILLMISSVIVIAGTLLLPPFFIIQTEKRDIEQQLGGVVQHNNEVIDIDIILDEAQVKLNILSAGVGSYQTASYIHEVILGYKTDSISLLRLTYDSKSRVDGLTGKIIVNGRSNNRKDLESFVESLRQDPLFSDIHDPIANYISEKDLSFSITINIAQHES